MSEVISTSATLKPYAINTGQFLINGSTGTNGQVIQTTGTGIQWATLPTFQWSGTSGQPITYTPFVGIGTTSTPTSNLQVAGNVYVSNVTTASSLVYSPLGPATVQSFIPTALGTVPFSLDIFSQTMANGFSSSYKLFGTSQATALNIGNKGYQGGFTDGRYGYYVPFQSSVGNFSFTRVDLRNFTAGGVTSVDLLTLPGNAQGSLYGGYDGGFTDGRYGYLAPCNNRGDIHGRSLRFDLQNFTTSGVTILDLTSVNTNAKGYTGGFTDGRYGYFCPYLSGTSGLIARFDLQNFTTGGVTFLDLTAVNVNAKGFGNGFTDGRYGYFIPYTTGIAARVDLQNFTTGGVTTVDLTAVNANAKGYLGGFTDGRYGYFVPFYNGTAIFGLVARIDLQNFTTSGVTFLDLTAVNANAKGYAGGFTDGRYGYFVPYTYNGSLSSGLAARIDLQNFTTGGVTIIDLTTLNGNAKGFYGGFTDGQHAYFVPYYIIDVATYSGLAARVQITLPPYCDSCSD